MAYDDETRSRAAAVANGATPRGRDWWKPVAIGIGVLLAAIIGVSQSRECVPVSRVKYPTDSAQHVAFLRGDSLPAIDTLSGTPYSVSVCGWRRDLGSRP